MTPIDAIIHALRPDPAESGDHKASREQLKTLLKQRFEEKKIEGWQIVPDNFENMPKVWEQPLLWMLKQIEADNDEEILKRVGNISEPATEPAEPPEKFGVHGQKVQGVVQSSYINQVVQHIGTAPEKNTPVSDIGEYLQHVIDQNRFLQLQGIRSGGKLVHVELDRIYITLRTTRQREVQAECRWLEEHCADAPGESRRFKDHDRTITETVTVSVNEALKEHTRLVILGDPGSGKTTLMRYLALLFAGDLTKKSGLVAEKLGLDESGKLPILVPFRKIGAFVGQSRDDGTEGHALLLDFLYRSLSNERVALPDFFFDTPLKSGSAVILFDGLDEVADPDLRRRVSRLTESFVRAYPKCRYVVTSRIVGYTGSAMLGEEFRTTTIQDFSLSDVESFLTHWHRLLAIGQRGPGDRAEADAADQTRHLMGAIRDNERVLELAINPLMLTVIALVHKDRVKLPDRRAELYAEAVDVLLGKWDEARGVKENPIFENRLFDAGDKRLVLQTVALTMHNRLQKEIPSEELKALLNGIFQSFSIDSREADKAVSRFLDVIESRTGLLSARGESVYSFSHLTFQEYLAALAICAKDDYIHYSIERIQDKWWREVILLEAGYLSTQSKERTTRLIRAISNHKAEPEPYHNLILAAECLRDAGTNRIEGDIEKEIRLRLRKDLEKPPSFFTKMLKKFGAKTWIEQRSKAMNALIRVGAGFWSMPYGEPEWIVIPAGQFMMGDGAEDDNKPHPVVLSEYSIARVPVTNTQYHLFVKATDYESPEGWENNRPPRGKESHPVVNVSWDDAMAYCRWLSKATGKAITLPAEAQWEKAARGTDQRIYPWGNTWDTMKCNSGELRIGDTTPVGVFPEGASPFGVSDMAGNVWEWCKDWYDSDYYENSPANNPEGPDSGSGRVVRGGSWDLDAWDCRSAYRLRFVPSSRLRLIGFRVLLLPRSTVQGQEKQAR